MRESKSLAWGHNPVPKQFGQSRHNTSGAGRVNRTLVGEVQALCTATVLDQQTVELARSLELRSGAYRAPALPVELIPAELARRFERRSRTYEARALPTELHQRNTLEAVGRIALPMICFAGRRLAVLATPPYNFGAEYGNCTRASGLAIRSTAPIRTPHGASSESRTRVISLEG